MSDSMLENRIIEILEEIREVLGRLATLEEKTIWHSTGLNRLGEAQKEMAGKIAEQEKDRSRLALLERELQYVQGELSKNSKQLEILTGIVAEMQRTGASQGKTVGFIERAGAQFILAILSAGGGALVMKLIGG